MDKRVVNLLEATLFTTSQPIETRLLQKLVPDGSPVEHYLLSLQKEYADRGVRLVRREDSWVFITAPGLEADLMIEQTVERRLSRAAMEILAIIAYYQPITRPEIEEIRGVTLARSTLDQLLEAGWVESRGHRPEPGRPTLWVTTTEFLHHFNLESLHDLPMRVELTDQQLVGEGRATPDAQASLFSYISDDT